MTDFTGFDVFSEKAAVADADRVFSDAPLVEETIDAIITAAKCARLCVGSIVLAAPFQ